MARTPDHPIIAIGPIVMVTDAEVIAASQWSKSSTVALGAKYEGWITGFSLSIEAALNLALPQCTLVFFDADPALANAAVALGAGEWATSIGHSELVTADWVGDTLGGVASKSELTIEFPELSNLYAAIFLTAAEASINNAAGDDHVLTLNVLTRRNN